MNKYVTYNGELVHTNTEMYKLMISSDEKATEKAAKHFKELSVDFNKNWPKELNHLRNWKIGV